MSLTRVRILTPEALDAAAANLVNTPSSQLGTAVASHAGTGGGTVSGVTTATPSTLMQRDANGRAQVATPSVSADIATKGYVDTTVAGYVTTASKGVASGVASLDSSGFVPASQVSAVFPRNLGSGTTFPSSKNIGDLFTHTGLNCLMRWDGNQWCQAGRATVANRAARDTMLSTYFAAIPMGFKVTQLDYRWIWKMDQLGWVWSGIEAANSIYSNSINQGPVFTYNSLNNSIASTLTVTTVSGFNYVPVTDGGFTDTEREVVTWSTGSSKFNFNDRCLVAVSALCGSSSGTTGWSNFWMNQPGGGRSFPNTNPSDIRHRGVVNAYPNYGNLNQPLYWTGWCNKGSTLSFFVNQQNPGNVAINTYNFYVSIQLLPT